MTAPLAGVRVIELAAYTTGPLAARYLSNLGAEVIKVEPLKGESIRGFAYKVDGVSYIFHVHNVNKKGVALETGTEQGRQVLFDLLEKADVLIENFAVGRMAEWGLDYPAVRTVNPSLVYCSLSGFGQTGPYRDRRAFDTVIQGMAAVMSLTGAADDPPTKIGVSAADNVGAAAGAMAIVAALHHRRRTGRGQHLDISMHDVQGWMTAEAWAWLDTPDGPGRHGNRHAALAPQNLYPAADGLVAIEVETQAQLDAVADLLGLDRCDFAEAKAQEAAFDAALTHWIAARPIAETMTECMARKIPAGAVQSMAEIAESPQTAARAMLVTLDHPVSGPLRLLGSPFRSSRGPGIVASTAPAVGQHTDSVLRDLLGYDSTKIAALRQAGVIGGTESPE